MCRDVVGRGDCLSLAVAVIVMTFSEFSFRRESSDTMRIPNLFFGIVFVMIYSIIKKTDCENCIEIFISCEKLFCEGIGHFVGIPHDFRRTVVFAWHCQVE